MKKKLVIASVLLLLAVNIMGQDNLREFTLINEVDSLYKKVMNMGNDQTILYYPDAAIKHGIILWASKNKYSGIAFKKVHNLFTVKQISNSLIHKSSLFEKFTDSFNILKNYTTTDSYNMSHDFNVSWVYSTKKNTDTVFRKFSELIGGNDSFGRTIFLKFEKLYEFSMPSIKSNRKNL